MQKCVLCENEITSRDKQAKYCSRQCYWTSLKGRSVSPNTQFKKGYKMPQKTIDKMRGRKPWNKGRPHPSVRGEKNTNWKGGRTSYSAKHHWLYRRASKFACTCCKQTHAETRLTWANISGKYERSLVDYLVLCYKCHWHFDRPNKEACHTAMVDLLTLQNTSL